ncbi:putative cell division protein ZipA [Alteromonas macleodii str. 'Black Sea 11']|nr:putative cell division protein ZipA [Alteromonas macleodii str. 'Black Sea 11']
MEDQLRLFLLLGGTVFIIAVLAHGIWKIRKNSKPSEKERLEPRQWQDDDNDFESDEQEGFDELGIGAVRVVSKSQNQEHEAKSSVSKNNANSPAHHDFSEKRAYDIDELDEDNGDNSSSQHAASKAHDDDNEGVHSEHAGKRSSNVGDTAKQSDAKEEAQKAPKLYGSVVTNPKPHMKGQARPDGASTKGSSRGDESLAAFPEPPGFLLREGEEQEETSLGSHVQREGSEQPNTPSNQERVDNAQSHDPIQSQAGGHQERGRAEPVRPAQKFYIDPTFEEEPQAVQPPARHEREVADFSLDAPEESVSSSDVHEENEQPRRFARNKRSKTPMRRREEPNFGDDQMRIDFDTSEAESSDFGDESFSANEDGSNSAGSAQKPAKSSSMEPEVLVLNVRTPEGEPISGAALLPMLLTLGFKFGDQDIFHRHVNSNGKGPVLFSLANMFKPGVFDIDNLENFETQGISLFMILPIEGDPHQVFNMMHNAARKLADEFGAQVLDGRRSVLTKQGLQQYVEKIREFERKRMIARN